jgi:AIPR protein
MRGYRVDSQEQDNVKAVEEALSGRSDLDIYGDNKRLLFAVQLRMDIDDIDGLAAEALTDGADDKASDLIYVDRDAGIILLAQGYESKKERIAASQAKAATLHQAVTWVFSHTTDDTPERLLPTVAELRAALVDDAIREIWVWFVHNLPESENVRRELNAIQSTVDTAIRADYPETKLDIHVDEVGRNTLARWYESSRSPILVTDEITVPVDDSCLTVHGPGWTAYTVTVTADWLNNTYWRYEEKLFSANVRGFLGARKSKDNINNGIRETLEGEPGNFWVFNNGITALVDDVSYNVDNKELQIHGLSIVNGAQTTGAVAKFREPDALRDARIVMRFIKCGDSAIVQKIIRFNNRQNVIDPADFRSNDRAQRRLVDEFKALGIEGYTGGRRGRGVDEVRKPAGAVDVASASRALAAYHGEPGIAYNERRLIWEDDRIYRHLFSEDTSAQHVLFCWSLIKAVEDCKARLRGLEDDLTTGKKEQRDYFEHPGSILLLVAAIAESMDAILGRPIANSFQPKFKGRPGPAKCMEYWRPIVDAIAPFARRNLTPVLKASGPPRELAKGALQDFRNRVESWAESGDERCKTFADKVKLTT